MWEGYLAKQQKIDFARKMARNSKLAQGAFFSMSYSQKGIDMALKQANAPEQIANEGQGNLKIAVNWNMFQ